MRLVLLAVTLASPLGLLAHAAGAQERPQFSACVGIDDDAQRLACYDAAAGRAPRGPPNVAAVSRGGVLAGAANIFHRDPSNAEPPVDYVVAQVVRSAEGMPYFVMTNREIWMPKAAPRRAPQAGDHVVIRRLWVGHYELTLPSGETFQVTRQ